MSANFKNIANVIVTNIAITAPNPALTPNKLRINENTSSIVVGIINSDVENFTGSANFRMPNIVLIEKNANKIIDAARACFLRLGKRDLIPLPIIAPCNNPIPTTTAKVTK
jgi:hypothetical protein